MVKNMAEPVAQDVSVSGQRLLALDGGGIRGLSQLYLIQELMHRIAFDSGLEDEEALPWKHFDLMAGSGTGGLIAILLGRLRLSTEQAIKAYTTLCEHTYEKKQGRWLPWRYSADENVKAELKAVIGADLDEYMAIDRPVNEHDCKVFVCTVLKENMDLPNLVRSYDVRASKGPNLTVWEAIRATTGHPFFDEPTVIGSGFYHQRLFPTSRYGWNNPLSILVSEFNETMSSSYSISCIVNVGSGRPPPLSLSDNGVIRYFYRFSALVLYQNIAADCERVVEEFYSNHPELRDAYFRINVAHGMESIELDEWMKLEKVCQHTTSYTKLKLVDEMIDMVVAVLESTGDFQSFEKVLQSLESHTDAFSQLLPIIAAVRVCISVYKKVSGDREEMRCQLERCEHISKTITRRLEDKLYPLDKTCFKEIARNITIERDKIERIVKSGRLSHHAQDKNIAIELNDSFQSIAEVMNQFQAEIQLCQEQMTADILKHDAFSSSSFPYSKSAPYSAAIDSENVKRGLCTDGTCHNIIETILNWARSADTGTQSIFWLNGRAGTGKTTIAYTIFERLRVDGMLSSSYFCSRQLDSGKSRFIIPTITRHLARKSRSYADQLLSQLQKDNDLAHTTLLVQFKELLSQPWRASKHGRTGLRRVHIIVIDALDECDNYMEFLLLLKVMAAGNLQDIKFILTSRPEPEIVERLGSITRDIIHLHEVPLNAVQHDICLFLKDKLGDILSDPEIDTIAKNADGLFIFASTIAEYVRPRQSYLDKDLCRDRYKDLDFPLEHPYDSSGRPYPSRVIDNLYCQIVDLALPRSLTSKEYKGRRKALHTLVCVREPMTAKTIAQLSALSEREVVATVRSLHSVLFESSSQIYFFHASFPDFLLSSKYAKEFSFNIPLEHRFLATQTFTNVIQHLAGNLRHFTPDDKTLNFRQQIQDKIDNASVHALRYSCRFWGYHFDEASDNANLLQSSYLELEGIKQSLNTKGPSTVWAAVDELSKHSLLEDLGILLFGCYEHFGKSEDIDGAIEIMKQVDCWTPYGHPSKLTRLSNLGKALSVRIECHGDLEDINEAITVFRQAALLSLDDHRGNLDRLSKLGNFLCRRIKRLGQLADIDESIEVHQQILSITPDGYNDTPEYQSDLGYSLLCRFEHTGVLEDINKSVKMLQQAVLLTPEGYAGKPDRLNNLGKSLLSRFERLGESSDIDQSIKAHRQAVSMTPDYHANKPIYLKDLGSAHFSRFERLEEQTDIDESIVRMREAALLIADYHAEKSNYLKRLVIFLHRRFECRREYANIDECSKYADIEESIQRKRQAVSFLAEYHADMPGDLKSLADALFSRFERLGELTDFDESIDTMRRAALLIADYHADKSNYLNRLVFLLHRRYKRLGDFKDIDESIERRRQAVSFLAEYHADMPGDLKSLADALFSRFERLRELADIDESVETMRRAALLIADYHADKSNYLNRLVFLLRRRLEHRRDNLNIDESREHADIDESIERKRQAVSFIPDYHADKPGQLDCLANILFSRFERLEERADIDESIETMRRAISLTPNDHTDKSNYLNSLQRLLCSRSIAFGEPSHL